MMYVIDFLSKWIEQIAIAVIIASIFEMLLPDGNIKKYVKMILGIYVVFSIILPFTDNKVMGKFDISKKIDEYSENNKYYANNEISIDKKLNKIYEDTFEKELIQTIEKEGFVVYKCVVKGNFNAEEKNAGISKIQIVLESQKIINKKSDGDNNIIKSDEANNKIKVENVDEVPKVEIKVDSKIKIITEYDVNAKDIDTLKKYLSKHYEIDKGIIEIHIR